MKDRSPKFPGRVKLLPVSGQENIYDMTRADDPDDTGTPFNTRTMLRDSTARFLRLPVSNPFVDDALRHMPDRVEPIGTVKTSPALSLGGAWLPCDGSQVTFAEYPQLCQILRNTVGTVTWDSVTVGTEPNFKTMSRCVKFKGKWYVAGAYSTGSVAYIKIAVSESINGSYSVVHSTSMSGGAGNSSIPAGTYKTDVQLAASNDRIVAVLSANAERSTPVGGGTDLYKFLVVTSEDGENWQNAARQYPSGLNASYTTNVPYLKEFDTDGEYWAFVVGPYVVYTSDPTSAMWSLSGNIPQWDNSKGHSPKLSYVNGSWLYISGDLVCAATVPNSWTQKRSGDKERISTNAVYYSGRYWFFTAINAASTGGNYLVHSSNLEDWVSEEVNGFRTDSTRFSHAHLLATAKQMVLAYEKYSNDEAAVFTTSDPDLGWSQVTLPASSDAMCPSNDGDILAVGGANMLAYHDYSTETRLLPTISLSSDTTTYIKAKNELDVFEAQESGGD
nr:MAG TPA: hypothetical protein [Caudoviricetes sp.]